MAQANGENVLLRATFEVINPVHIMGSVDLNTVVLPAYPFVPAPPGGAHYGQYAPQGYPTPPHSPAGHFYGPLWQPPAWPGGPSYAPIPPFPPPPSAPWGGTPHWEWTSPAASPPGASPSSVGSAPLYAYGGHQQGGGASNMAGATYPTAFRTIVLEQGMVFEMIPTGFMGWPH
ncbi:hypothetical protein DENSPDRAFT_852029 [Dentipellis sp. KUC8613]|nr:hypothetical protein DENSPDRAFT_852029 [Dentipellis sp. KUC8613]